jgi:hypothetical protein
MNKEFLDKKIFGRFSVETGTTRVFAVDTDSKIYHQSSLFTQTYPDSNIHNFFGSAMWVNSGGMYFGTDIENHTSNIGNGGPQLRMGKNADINFYADYGGPGEYNYGGVIYANYTTGMLNVRGGVGGLSLLGGFSATLGLNVDGYGFIGVGTNAVNQQAMTIQGYGSTSATNSLLIQNSSLSNLVRVRDDGNVSVGTLNPSYRFQVNQSSSTAVESLFRVTNYSGGINYFKVESTSNDYADITSNLNDTTFLINVGGSGGKFKITDTVYTASFETTKNFGGFLFTTGGAIGASGEYGVANLYTPNFITPASWDVIANSILVGATGTESGIVTGLKVQKQGFTNTGATFYSGVFMDGNVGIGTTSPLNTLQVGLLNGTATVNINGGNGLNSTLSIQGHFAGSGYIFDSYNAVGDRAFAIANQDGDGIGTNASVSLMSKSGIAAITAYDVNYGTRRIGLGFHYNLSPALMVSREDIFSTGTQGLFLWDDTLSGIEINSVKGLGHARPYLTMASYSGSPTTYLGSVMIHSNGNSYFNGGNVGIGTATPNYGLHVKKVGLPTGFAASIESPENVNAASFFYFENNQPVYFMQNTIAQNMLTLRVSGDSWFNGGNVGIGTSTPSSRLTVNSNGTAYTELVRFINGASTSKFLMYDNGETYFHPGSSQTVLHTAGRWDFDNTVTIGKPTYDGVSRVMIKGAGSTSATNSLLVQNSSTVNTFVIKDDGFIGAGNVSSGSMSIGFNSNPVFSNYHNVAVGLNTMPNLTVGERNSMFGHGAGYSTIGASRNTGIGAGALYYLNNGFGNIGLGWSAGSGIYDNYYEIAIGVNALTQIHTGTNIAIGSGSGSFDGALSSLTAGTNTVIGNGAGAWMNTSTDNVLVGLQSMARNRRGNRNTVVGQGAGEFAVATASDNIYIGYLTGHFNNEIGDETGTVGGDKNVFIGTYAGQAYTGNSSVIIGYSAGLNNIKGTNQLIIDNGNNTIPLIYGDFYTRRVGLGTISPNTKLDINGDLAHRATTPATFNTNQNDFSTSGTSFIRLESTGVGGNNVTGFADGSDGKRLVVTNVGSNVVTLTNEDAGSSAANRMILYSPGAGSTADYSLVTNDVVELIYDSTTQRWRKIN